METFENTKPNYLHGETSPYLLQHALNPVKWFPWCEEAFNKSKAENKPIFLSIGYSTCHWCHVMAHESFEDETVAQILNENFVCIKVDREERPDVDSVYMDVCQAFTGSGGWPMSIFMDGEKQPFYAGTYYPTEVFKQLLVNINSVWQNDKKKLTIQANNIVNAVKRFSEKSSHGILDNVDTDAINSLIESFDQLYGGFSSPPKFPTPQNLLFIFDYFQKTNRQELLIMCLKTLSAMRDGGIYDHVGGGFSRYSTDRKWLVPHFEKMLYDNALLMIAYSRAFEITNNSDFKNTANEIAEYLTRDLMDTNGAFYTAEDADSNGVEGEFYIFSFDEITKVLKEHSLSFCQYFNVTKNGNFDGKNILNTINNVIPDSEKQQMQLCLKKLFDCRNKRNRPHRDEKILLGLNGLAIAAFAIAGKVLNQPSFVKTAETVLAFINSNLSSPTKRFYAYFKNDKSKTLAFGEDYAFLIWGLIELYKSTDKQNYLDQAQKVQHVFSNDFFDQTYGGFYMSAKDSETLIYRKKEIYDGAIPSCNSVAMHNLLDLFELTSDINYLKQLAKTLNCFSSDIARFPVGHIHSTALISRLKPQLLSLHFCTDNVCRPAPKSISEFLTFTISQ